jgi:hypothetical protein
MAVSLEAPSYVYDALGEMMGMALDRIRRLRPDLTEPKGAPLT